MPPIARIASNDLVLVLSRLAMLSMPVVLPLMGWLALQYLDYRFAEVRTVAVEAATKADSLAGAAATAADNTSVLNARVDVIEANMASSSADRMAFQKDISRQVEKLTDAVTATSVQVSGIGATLNAMRASDTMAILPGRP